MTRLQTWRGRLQAVALAGAAVALVATTGVAARQDSQRAPGARGMREPMMFRQLDLSADQETRIQAIFEKHREADKATFEQLRTSQRSLHQAIFAVAPDPAQIEELTSQISNLEAKALRARVATQMEIASVLTDEQRQKAIEMRPPDGRRGPRAPRGPGGPGGPGE